MELHQKECIPCQGGVPPLPLAEKQRLLQEIGEGWELTHHDTRLFKDYKFKTFQAAMDFAIKLGEMAEEQGHHPELHVGWGHCGVEIWTHKIDNLVESDFIYAAKAEKIFLASE
jgi:4a-hydroxytetrahydrobiopterin dehydratase